MSRVYPNPAGEANSFGGMIRGSRETAGGRHGAWDGYARGPGRGIDVGSAAGRPGRCRSDQPVRCPHISNEDRRGGERLPLARDLGENAARWDNHGRNTQLALAAAAQAIEQSGLTEYAGRDNARFGVYLGAGEGQQDFSRFVDLLNRASGARRLTPVCSRSSGWECSID